MPTRKDLYEEPLNPTRLVIARKRRGFNKEAVAEKVGITRLAYAAHENGKSIPRAETLEKIASVLEYPITFFFGPDLELPDGASFRSLSRMSARTRNMALAQAALALHFSQWLEAKFEMPSAKGKIVDLRHERPAEAARALRAIWDLGELPIRNMVHLLESKGVKVFSLSIESRDLDAISIWQEDTPFVFLNTQKTPERSRFDAAHELGHLVLHQHGEARGRKAEAQADQFASEFLMPESGFVAHVRRTPTLAGMIQAKKRWGVSLPAFNRRLHDLGLSSDWMYRRFCIEIAKRYRAEEPDSIAREASLVLPKTLSVLYEEGMNRNKIAETLSIPTKELEELLSGLVMTSITGGGRGSNVPSPQLVRVK